MLYEKKKSLEDFPGGAHLHGSQSCWGEKKCRTQWRYEQCRGGPPKTGHSEEFWQKVAHWRREWQTTSVSLPEESHGQRSLEGYSPQGRKEWDTRLKRLNTAPSDVPGKFQVCWLFQPLGGTWKRAGARAGRMRSAQFRPHTLRSCTCVCTRSAEQCAQRSRTRSYVHVRAHR